MVHTDTRSFILKKPKLSEEIVLQNQQLGKRAADAIRVLSGRLIQTRYKVTSFRTVTSQNGCLWFRWDCLVILVLCQSSRDL